MKTFYTGMVYYPNHEHDMLGMPTCLLDCDYAEFESLEEFKSVVLTLAESFMDEKDFKNDQALQKLIAGDYEIEESTEDGDKYVCVKIRDYSK